MGSPRSWSTSTSSSTTSPSACSSGWSPFLSLRLLRCILFAESSWLLTHNRSNDTYITLLPTLSSRNEQRQSDDIKLRLSLFLIFSEATFYLVTLLTSHIRGLINLQWLNWPPPAPQLANVCVVLSSDSQRSKKVIFKCQKTCRTRVRWINENQGKDIRK